MTESAADRVQASFRQRFACAPRWLASAPGRVNVIGEFTDYNDGFVLPMSLGQRTQIAASPNDSDHIRILSAFGGERVFSLTGGLGPCADRDWSVYARGVAAEFAALHSGLRGVDAVIETDIPVGGGLSSSAALTVALCTLLEAVCDVRLDPLDKALLCQRVEHRWAGVPCGIMDPLICTMGRAGQLLLLDCRSMQCTWLTFDDPAVALLVINSHVKHQLSGGEYAQRRHECERACEALGVGSLRDASMLQLSERAALMDEPLIRRARHVISEISRTQAAAECIRSCRWEQLGELLYAGHKSLQCDYAVSCRQLDLLVDIGRTIGIEGGVLGCRMTGGGFGGCMVALIRPEREVAIVQRFVERYRELSGIEASIFRAAPSTGAQLLELRS